MNFNNDIVTYDIKSDKKTKLDTLFRWYIFGNIFLGLRCGLALNKTSYWFLLN